jgi:hypothetical protein
MRWLALLALLPALAQAENDLFIVDPSGIAREIEVEVKVIPEEMTTLAWASLQYEHLGYYTLEGWDACRKARVPDTAPSYLRARIHTTEPDESSAWSRPIAVSEPPLVGGVAAGALILWGLRASPADP